MLDQEQQLRLPQNQKTKGITINEEQQEEQTEQTTDKKWWKFWK